MRKRDGVVLGMILVLAIGGSALGQVLGNWIGDETIGTETKGSSTLDGGICTITGSGVDILDEDDWPQFLYRERRWL